MTYLFFIVDDTLSSTFANFIKKYLGLCTSIKCMTFWKDKEKRKTNLSNLFHLDPI